MTGATREAAGRLADGTPVEAVRLVNGNGVTARILDFGATLQSLVAPDREGRFAEITLGHDDVTAYEAGDAYFGATVGRVCNRIGGARLVLDGVTYPLAANDGPNALHGGVTGFNKRRWAIRSVQSAPVPSVTLALSSPNGDMGFPGHVEATVTFALDADNTLSILFEATTDRPTVVAMTSHTYFNLGGDGSAAGAMGHRLTVAAGRFLPVDAALLPTGEMRDVSGTAFDFRQGRVIGERVREGNEPQLVHGRGYDHAFVLDKGETREPEFAARLEDPASGRVLDVLSTAPGLQFYSGNFLDGRVAGRGGTRYRMGDGIALEPEALPDTPNRPEFGSIRLDPGETYRHAMAYRLSVSP